jgi:hypothetical protein
VSGPVAIRSFERGVAESSSATHGPDRRRGAALCRATESQTVSERAENRVRPTLRLGLRSTGATVGLDRKSEAPWRDSCRQHACQGRRQWRGCYETLRPMADSVKKSGYAEGRVVPGFSQAASPGRPTRGRVMTELW